MTTRSASASVDRRTVIASAVILAGALLLGVAVVALTYDSEPTATTTTAAGAEVAAPRIIPRPDEGTGPEDAGDPGGWAQLVLLGMIVVVIAGIGVYVFRGGGAKARAGREAWKAAGETGEDGVLEPRTTPAAGPSADSPGVEPEAEPSQEPRR